LCRYLKLYTTKKERLSVGVLLSRLERELGHQSRTAESVQFAISPTLERKDWVESQIWLKNAKKAISTGRGGLVFVPSNDILEKELSTKDLREKLREARTTGGDPVKGEKFRNYVRRITSFYELHVLEEKNGDIYYSCSCPQYQKYAKCKHSLGCGIHFAKNQVPEKWVATSLADKSKVGRPKKAGQCLLKQN